MRRTGNRTPRLTLDDLLDRAREHRARGQVLADLLQRRRNVSAEASAEIAAVLADNSPSSKAYKLLGKAQHTADAKKIASEKTRLIEPHLSRALFEAKHHHDQLQQALADLEDDARQPPSLEDAIMMLTGAPGWSLDQMLMGSLLEQITLRNCREDIAKASASRRESMYDIAEISPFDPVNSVIIRVLETEKIPYPAGGSSSPEEAAAAARLGRMIEAAQTKRLPDTSEIRTTIKDVGHAISHAELAGVRGANPDLSVERPEPLPAAAGAGAGAA